MEKKERNILAICAFILTLVSSIFFLLLFLSAKPIISIIIFIATIVLGIYSLIKAKNYKKPYTGFSILAIILVSFFLFFLIFTLLLGIFISTTTYVNLIESPSISQDDEAILFTYYNTTNLDSRGLYNMNVDGTEVERLIYLEDQLILNPKFSPNKLNILFVSWYLGGRQRENTFLSLNQSDLYIMDSNGSNLKKLTNDSLIITKATFSSEGDKIYFLGAGWYGHYSPIAGSRPHNYDVYSINTDGSEFKKLTNLNSYGLGGLELLSNNELVFYYSLMDELNFYILNLENGELKDIGEQIKQVIGGKNLKRNSIEQIDVVGSRQDTIGILFEDGYGLFDINKGSLIHIPFPKLGGNQFISRITHFNNEDKILFVKRKYSLSLNGVVEEYELWTSDFKGNLKQILFDVN